MTFPLQQWSDELQTIVVDFTATCTLGANPTTSTTINGITFTNLGEIYEELMITGTPGVNDYLGVINTWAVQGSTYAYPDTTAAPEYRQVSVSLCRCVLED